MRLLREHLAAWTTLAFAVLLILLTVSDGPPMGFVGVLLLLWAFAMLGVWLIVQQETRQPRGPEKPH